ncbi:MAG: STY4526/YPO1902 family pathogenicity island replication protein [Cardiobacteriaceae bacterium]|nr:STY4526/YPO1902 family pathogenicity island replication protein [Cardiobacteriaceae bacterium]
MNVGQEINIRLRLAVLMEVISAAKHGTPLHQQMGISDDTLQQLSLINLDEWYTLARSPFLDIMFNNRALNLAIQNILQHRDRDNLLEKALQYGASREIMQHYGSMSHNDFNRLRQKLKIEAIRRRPSRISAEDYTILSELHNKFGMQNTIQSRMTHLRCLIYLAENSGIDINQIYHYYYKDNSSLFANKKGNES